MSPGRATGPRLIFLGVLLGPCLTSCSGGVLDPQGQIGTAERVILIDSLAIMLVIVVPTILVTLAVAWWYRASNTRAKYLPDWAYSGQLEVIVWAIPVLVVMFLGGIAWIGSHDLDPYKPVDSPKPPLEVQVVSLDWKWLFIYPAQGIASVNELVMPVGTPVHFRLTSATVMNSFFVPQLGSQIYTMAGMTSQLNLIADKPGVYRGISAQFSGDGFSDMHFDVRAETTTDFSAWIEKAHAAENRLDAKAWESLSEPAVEPKVIRYGSVEGDFFETILKQSAAATMPPGTQGPVPPTPRRPES